MSYLASGSRRFGSSHEQLPDDCYRRVHFNLQIAQAIATSYLDAPRQDEQAHEAYALFCRETMEQYHYLIGREQFGGLGVTVRFVDFDPYPDAIALAADLRNRQLLVFTTAASGNPHPYLSDGQNDIFRAVHDAFGHGATGRAFDPHGEEAAWLKHAVMYSPLARRALTTETRGQNCTLAMHSPDGHFPEQKAALLPAWCSDLRSVILR